MMKLIVDISRYQGGIDTKILKENNVQMVVCKSSSGCSTDAMFKTHAQAIIDGGMQLGVYHWVDPIIDAGKQARYFLELIEPYREYLTKDLSGQPIIWNDFEQWWSNWGSWYTNGIQKGKWHLVKAFAGSKISETSRTFNQIVKASGYNIGVYTSAGFVKEHAPQASAWIKDYPVITANYPNTVQAKTWADFWSKVAPAIDSMTPAIPAGTKTLAAWQFTGDRHPLPGTYSDTAKKRTSNIDLSKMYDPMFVIGSKSDGYELPAYTAVVTAWALTIRKSPTTSSGALGYLKMGDEVKVWEEFGAWSRIGVDQWVGNKYLRRL